jgi:hypothetical protein
MADISENKVEHAVSNFTLSCRNLAAMEELYLTDGGLRFL